MKTFLFALVIFVPNFAQVINAHEVTETMQVYPCKNNSGLCSNRNEVQSSEDQQLRETLNSLKSCINLHELIQESGIKKELPQRCQNLLPE